jgi:pimeloyl-ACP methyl ester carboxylesterase
MVLHIQLIVLGLTTIYGAIACLLEDRTPPPGERIAIDGGCLHLSVLEANPEIPPAVTIVLDHSLGGIEGYLLAEQFSNYGRVCFFDRAGYGWSDHSSHGRTSDRIVTEVDAALTQAGIQPPYLLVGDSFGSYNMRLYAHRYPEKVMGLVLTDGLHESGMLNMPIALQGLKLVFLSGFVVATIGAMLGIIRVLKDLGIFELLKPELRQCSPDGLTAVKRSFCRPKHWITMTRELWNLDQSGRQMLTAESLGDLLGDLPIVSIKSASFFQPAWWTRLIPLGTANGLRDRMHEKLSALSKDCIQLDAQNSGHFVWTDEPEIMAQAIEHLQLRSARS